MTQNYTEGYEYLSSQFPEVSGYDFYREMFPNNERLTSGIWIIPTLMQFICIGNKRPMVLSECAEESCSLISGKMITWNLSNKIR